MEKISKEEILNQRAMKLAKIGEENEDSGLFLEVVTFTLENSCYAIEPCYIQEIFTIKDVTFLPNVPSFVYGLINVRRKVFSIIDLKNIFNISSITQSQKAILLQNHATQFVILTDTVLGLENLLLEYIQPTIPTLTGIKEEILRGITNEGLVILDGSKLLSHKELLVQQYV